MKAKTIEKVVKGKKSYTMAEIREAIAYWKGRLASVNEDEEKIEAAVDDDKKTAPNGKDGKDGKDKNSLLDEKAV